ncbi:hypothetical protein FT643_08925 [Ketobacter sp. MCCC 1A13808]|uniref:hypothetical protein n=1 Tax=Ketobacter sp. MCCC 1A13808 TaxID=2602738 RepID=UPI0012EB55F5|nr:hypothetical protein [Ketobacter sp. MCCC 1A13808]MVF12268.1 hypothetical protein [Ketobacter sp. MCCC 1A13808]
MVNFCSKSALLKISLLFLLPIMISACGGGGGNDEPAPPAPNEIPRDTDQPEPEPEPEAPTDNVPPVETPTPTDIPGFKQTLLNYRLKSATIDFDFNGTPDEVVNFTYDATGKLTNLDSVYSGDSAEDNQLIHTMKATPYFAFNFKEVHESTVYDTEGKPTTINNSYSLTQPPVIQKTTSELLYGPEGLISITANHLDENRAVQAITKVSYLDFVNGLPNRITNEYEPAITTNPAVIAEVRLNRDSWGRVEFFERTNSDGQVIDRNTVVWDGDLISKFETESGNVDPNLATSDTIDFEYEGNCIKQERFVSKSVFLGFATEYLTTASYIYDEATGRPLYLDIDNDSDGSIEARMEFEFEDAPHLIQTYVTTTHLDRSDIMEHTFYCMAPPKPL